MTEIHLAKGCIIALRLVLVVKCVLICLVLNLYTGFESTHLVLKVIVIKPGAQAPEPSSGIHPWGELEAEYNYMSHAPEDNCLCASTWCVLPISQMCLEAQRPALLALEPSFCSSYCFSEGPKLGGGSSDLSSTSLVIWLKLLRFPAGS